MEAREAIKKLQSEIAEFRKQRARIKSRSKENKATRLYISQCIDALKAKQKALRPQALLK